MKLKVTITSGKRTEILNIAPAMLERFLAGAQQICNETKVAIAYQVESERRGITHQGMILPA